MRNVLRGAITAAVAGTAFSALSIAPSTAAVRNVPASYSTIGAALAASAPGDTVLVAAGTYSPSSGESFPLVMSTNSVSLLGAGMSLSILDAAGTAGVVHHTAAVGGRVADFTITGGLAVDGAGIRLNAGNAAIDHNLLVENGAELRGSGIFADPAGGPAIAPWIHHNVVWSNFDTNDADATDPHGVYLSGQTTGIVEHNLVARSDGNGMLTFSGATPTIRHNIFLENGVATPTPRGRGICWTSGTPARISHNLFFANVLAAVLWPAGGGNLTGALANAVSPTDLVFGNLDGNPLLVDADGGDYHLQSASPAIDAGDPTLPFDPDGTIADLGPFFFDQDAVGAPAIASPAGGLLDGLRAVPNPVFARTVIGFSLGRAAHVTASITDVRGRRVRDLGTRARSAGAQDIEWDARDDAGRGVAAGIYFVRIEANGVVRAAPIVRLR